MIWRIRFTIREGHIHCAIFLAPGPDRTFAKCGDFVVCKGAEFASLAKSFDADFVGDSITEASAPLTTREEAGAK